MSSYFFSHAEKKPANAGFLGDLEDYAENNKQLIYVLNRPLTDQKYTYSYQHALIILSPKNKIAIIDYGNGGDAFENYVEDVLEDIGSISDKYQYKEVVGRPRQWRNTLLEQSSHFADVADIDAFFDELSLQEDLDKRKIDLLISLFIGSINDIDRVKKDIPFTILDKVKQKIQLFDGDQTRFIYDTPNKKRIRIQGLSGTGKTELLLHKLKDLYIGETYSKICFTCYNKILADTLRRRIPKFFDFMKVEQQIVWGERLVCAHSWGSASSPNSGAYTHICNFYKIPFHRSSWHTPFSRVCRLAIDDIKAKHPDGKINFAFTYMFIDESQDFDETFFELCEMVTEKRVYIAGDIFQNIFDENISASIDPDFLLGKCYRTDPKTLMFAHALGMGLFEKTKLRWLEAKEWQDCGYNVTVTGNQYVLSREPLRRFEDLAPDYESIKIAEIEASYSDTVVEIIQEIKAENETVMPEDIGIIFIDQDKEIYQLADVLEVKIQKKLQWDVNKAYETKANAPGAIFISNRNNVKGLEFPFVICVTRGIKNSLSYRNSMYTMLTRSFIKSYLLVPVTKKSGLTVEMKSGLTEIVATQQMTIQEPTEAEKKKIKTSFKNEKKRLSHYDLMMQILRKLKVEEKYHEKMFAIVQEFDLIESDPETLTDFVKQNIKFLKIE